MNWTLFLVTVAAVVVTAAPISPSGPCPDVSLCYYCLDAHV